MSIRRWLSGTALALIGLGAAGAIGAGHLEDLDLGTLPRMDRVPDVRVLDELREWPLPAPEVQAGPAATGSAAEALQALGTRQSPPPSDYDRDAFGQRWADIDRNGCDQRNDTLRAQLQNVQIKPGTHGCKVVAGTLKGPYTGETIEFTVEAPGAVQIDHVVSLSDAWNAGAWEWTPEQREQFANDFGNLLAVDGPTNQAKSDHTAADWLPHAPAARCDMVTRQIEVKAQWNLTVTARERAAMQQVLAGCDEAA